MSSNPFDRAAYHRRFMANLPKPEPSRPLRAHLGQGSGLALGDVVEDRLGFFVDGHRIPYHALSAAAFLPAILPKAMHSARLPPPWYRKP